jgi:hypothetical protein
MLYSGQDQDPKGTIADILLKRWYLLENSTLLQRTMKWFGQLERIIPEES